MSLQGQARLDSIPHCGEEIMSLCRLYSKASNLSDEEQGTSSWTTGKTKQQEMVKEAVSQLVFVNVCCSNQCVRAISFRVQ